MTTTTAPATAGTTYPLPPAPSWADQGREDTGGIRYDVAIGSVSVEDAEPVQVSIGRTDWIDFVARSMRQDITQVYACGTAFSSAEARALAELLVQAADLAEQS